MVINLSRENNEVNGRNEVLRRQLIDIGSKASRCYYINNSFIFCFHVVIISHFKYSVPLLSFMHSIPMWSHFTQLWQEYRLRIPSPPVPLQAWSLVKNQTSNSVQHRFYHGSILHSTQCNWKTPKCAFCATGCISTIPANGRQRIRSAVWIRNDMQRSLFCSHQYARIIDTNWLYS